jgi:peptide/nickel transport system substrate-binding protein
MLRTRTGLPALLACMVLLPASPAQQPGGSLTLALRAEPKTLNPVTAVDGTSREVIHRLMADLIHINRETHRTEPALAESWTASRDGRTYTLRLRRGLRFSDGHPFDAADVLFTFRVYLDPKIASPQRDLLVIGGKPIAVRRQDSHTLVFELAQPYAAAERIFDSIAMLPRHLLEKPYLEGKLAEAWSLNAEPAEIAGLGPFRLKQYVPGQRVVLERNPYYWKPGRPYLESLVFLVVGGEDAQVVRFQAGETGVISRLGARNYAALEKQRAAAFRLHDLGPGLEYNFLFFNLNTLAGKDLPRVAARQSWFRKPEFRQAVSTAIDRDAIVKLVYQNRATPLWGHVTPGNRLWVNPRIPRPPRDLERARQLLRAAGFSWRNGSLHDEAGRKVEFTIIASASNAERVQIATVIQEDLKQIGLAVNVASLEFRALLDRLLKTHDYEACVLGLGGGDADPNSEMNVWLSTGSTHLWNLGGTAAAGWEREIDTLMKRQLVTLDYKERKRLYDRVQELVAQNMPIIPLVSPNVLAGAKHDIGNFRPVILDHNTLWNVEEIFRRR